MVCGRFLLEEPKTRIEASFFSEKNSREAESSKGWTAFFFVNFLASGMRSWYRSVRASWTIWEQVVPRRKRAVLGFSVGFGAFLSRARLLRALRGLLERLASSINYMTEDIAYICRNILTLWCGIEKWY